jgi:hypothetical protein
MAEQEDTPNGELGGWPVKELPPFLLPSRFLQPLGQSFLLPSSFLHAAAEMFLLPSKRISREIESAKNER